MIHGEIGVGKTTFIRHLVNYLQANNHLNQTESITDFIVVKLTPIVIVMKNIL